ncbi:hypothetical protein G7Z17_g2567 [Cylindrodendrum hubeiense]|uniref:Uncharacterized protein n=1 Tax=Cylindrodendrum hubeiense TaxID=595255 RepID=A0A9P5LED3_9HYPO|nr:hypothetical protein G7Z17_g2567 [Cylindrodendrum hubeiense]
MADIANPHTLREWAVTTFEPLKNDAKLRSEMTTEKAARAFIQWVAKQVEDSHKKLQDFGETERNEQEEIFLTTLAIDIEHLLDRIHEEEMKVEVSSNDPVVFIGRFLEQLRLHDDRTGRIDWFNEQSMEWEAEASFISRLVGEGTDAWTTKVVDTLQKGDNMTSEQIAHRWPSFSAWLNEKLREIREELSREVLFKSWIVPQLEGMTRSLDFTIDCAQNVTNTSVAEKTPCVGQSIMIQLNVVNIWNKEVWLGLTAQSANMAFIEDRLLTEENLQDIPWAAVITATENWLNKYWVLIEQVQAMFLRDGVRDRVGRYILWNTTEVDFFETLEDSKFKVICVDDAFNVLLEKGLANNHLDLETKDKVAEWFQLTYNKIQDALNSIQAE